MDDIVIPCPWCGHELYDRVISLKADLEYVPRCSHCLNDVSSETIDRIHGPLRNTLTALALTYSTVPTDGSRPHWCRFPAGHHDPTCSGMMHIQDEARAVVGKYDSLLDVELSTK